MIPLKRVSQIPTASRIPIDISPIGLQTQTLWDLISLVMSQWLGCPVQVSNLLFLRDRPSTIRCVSIVCYYPRVEVFTRFYLSHISLYSSFIHCCVRSCSASFQFLFIRNYFICSWWFGVHGRSEFQIFLCHHLGPPPPSLSFLTAIYHSSIFLNGLLVKWQNWDKKFYSFFFSYFKHKTEKQRQAKRAYIFVFII